MSHDDQRRATEYHEAGHTAIAWLLGVAIREIDMRPTLSRHAIIRLDWPLSLREADLTESENRRRATVEVKWRTLLHLAGHAAVNRASQEPDPHWLFWKIEDAELDGDDPDILRPLDLAETLYGKGGRKRSFLLRMGDWTDGLLADPRVWQGVEALAERLAKIKTRMDGFRAFRLLDQASGIRGFPPVSALGRKWRRRLWA